MQVHLVDGTYELFRHHYALPSSVRDREGTAGATRGVLYSILDLLEKGATHVGVATDHVIESFRNDLWPGYKTSAGMPEILLAQFGLLEECLDAMGVVVWPMVEREADDGLAAAAAVAAASPDVDQVLILTPDKDLAQCVVGDRVVQVDRRRQTTMDEAGVVAKFGVLPESIPDWLALVGDSADGFPGLPGWGAKASSRVLARYRHLEEIPVDATQWDVAVPSRVNLARTLVDQLENAILFRTLARLRTDPPVMTDVDELRWRGPQPGFEKVAETLGGRSLAERVAAVAAR